MTCRDFMHYLIYVEHSAENLQFYLWLLDYTARFKSLSPNDRVLSTEVVPSAYACAESANNGSISGSNSITDACHNKAVTRFFADKFQAPSVRLSVPAPTKENPFRTPPETPMSAQAPSYSFEKPSGSESGMIAPFLSETATLRGVDHATVAADAFQAVGMRWQPCKFFIFFSLVLGRNLCCSSGFHSPSITQLTKPPQLQYSPSARKLVV